MYDGYRPQAAVDEFCDWGNDLNDISAKNYYYPTLEKKALFEAGYVPQKTSMHSRGSTFDLTLIKIEDNIQPIKYLRRVLTNGEEIFFLDDGTVDMGSSFDLFHQVSHHDSSLVNYSQAKMRNFLRDGMKRFGFKEYQEEWWHYSLKNEPYPNTYFDFVVDD